MNPTTRALILVFVVARGPAVWGGAQTPAVHPGDQVLSANALTPSVDTIRSWRIERETRSEVSVAIRTVERVGDGWLIVVDHRATAGGDRTVDSTLVAADDLHLLRKSVFAATDSAVVSYEPGRVVGWAAPPGEERRTIDFAADHPVYPDDGLFPWLWTLLPLQPGYSAVIETFNPWDGTLHTVRHTVLARETITHRGREVDCWVVASDALERWGITGRSWVAVRDRRFVRTRGEDRDGVVYVSERN